MTLYNLKSLAEGTFMIAKFSDDFEVESTYTLTAKGFSYTCDCPANNRTVITKPCRHKLMMPALLPAVDTDRFYDFDTKMSCTPLGDLLRPEANPEGREALPDAGEALRAESPNMTATEIEEGFKKMCSGPDRIQEAAWEGVAPLIEQMHGILVKEGLAQPIMGEAPGSSIEPPPAFVEDTTLNMVAQTPGAFVRPAPTIRRR